MLRLDRLARLRVINVGVDIARLEPQRRKDIWRGEHRLATQLADAGLMQQGLVGANPGCVALLLCSLQFHPAGDGVRVVDLRHRLVQALAVLRRQLLQQLRIGRH